MFRLLKERRLCSRVERKRGSKKLNDGCDHGGLANFHPSVSEGKFDVEWLRNACDRIVNAIISQLSRYELAMAVCRTLDSDKPGNEIAGNLLDLVGDSSFETVQDLILVTIQTESER